MSQDALHHPPTDRPSAGYSSTDHGSAGYSSTDYTDPVLRARAEKRLEARRGLGAHALAYVLVNGFLVVIWALNGVGEFFWPVFPILGWGIGLAFNAWDVLVPGPSEDRIRAEMDRLRRS